MIRHLSNLPIKKERKKEIESEREGEGERIIGAKQFINTECD